MKHVPPMSNVDPEVLEHANELVGVLKEEYETPDTVEFRNDHFRFKWYHDE